MQRSPTRREYFSKYPQGKNHERENPAFANRSFFAGPTSGEDLGLPKCPMIIAVSSGKGGVGKTNIAANLGFAFSKLQKKVLLLDGNVGLGNIDVLLGLNSRYNVYHLLNGKIPIFEVLNKGPNEMWILPACSGSPEITSLDASQKILLLNELDQIKNSIDILLIDTGAVSSDTFFFILYAEELILVTTPEFTSIAGTYNLIKLLAKKDQKKKFTILINFTSGGKEAKETFKTLTRMTDRFLGHLSFDYLGFIPFDEKLKEAVKNQRLVTAIYPRSPASQRFRRMARYFIQIHKEMGGAKSNLKSAPFCRK